MQTISDTSYGIIPLSKTDKGWEVFLINQIGRRGDTFWTFPKGHPEASETPKETALRELFEETGMKPTEIFPLDPLLQAYEFVHEHTLVQKESFYFLGLITDPQFIIQEREVMEAGWFPLEDAVSRLTHAQAKEMLIQVKAYLKDKV